MVHIADTVKVIDTDTHLLEPPDLWTSRVAARWRERVPQVRWEERNGKETWFLGDERMRSVASTALAGWHEYPPDCPRRWSEADPAAWDARRRLARMDSDGVFAQIVYPNLTLLNAETIRREQDPALQQVIVQTYNDYQTEWSSAAPDRLLPITFLPFWDLEASLAEMRRCRDLGHRGVVFTQSPSSFGLPMLTDRHWDPLWAAAQEMAIPVSFHIASTDSKSLPEPGHPDIGLRSNFAFIDLQVIMSSARTVAELICGGICHRFPDLAFVSAESGIGWIPFALDALDWEWKVWGVTAREHPEYDLLPSEYFRRQIFCSFWFERESLGYCVERLGADNVMYETDYPHPGSNSPGPASPGVPPRQFIAEVFAGVAPEVSRKILHDNAARLWRLL